MSEGGFCSDWQGQRAGVEELLRGAVAAGALPVDEAERLRSDFNSPESELTVAVIGQIKAGKSTFLNSLLFGDEVLPSATSPMTAALTVVRFGSREGLRAEFYSPEEWGKLEELARSGGDSAEARAAGELVGDASKRGLDTAGLTRKGSQEDSLARLREYVGKEGHYTPVVKSVEIAANHEWLRGIRLVDTPGTNDPVVSREQRTRAFLREAHAVLLLLYAGQNMTDGDIDLIRTQLPQCGVGALVVGINKYDVQLTSPTHDRPEQVEASVEGSFVKMLEEERAKNPENAGCIERQLGNARKVAFSSLLSLLARMSPERLQQLELYREQKERLSRYNRFHLDDRELLLEESRQKLLEDELLRVVKERAGELLLGRPVRRVVSALDARESQLKTAVATARQSRENLDLGATELVDRQAQLRDVRQRLSGKLDDLDADVEDAVRKVCREGAQQMRSAVEETYGRLEGVLRNFGRTDDWREVALGFQREWQRLYTGTLKDIYSGTLEQAEAQAAAAAQDFLEGIRRRSWFSGLLSDEDSEDVLRSLARQARMEADSEGLFDYTPDGVKQNNAFWQTLDNATLGILGRVGNFMMHDYNKRGFRQELLNWRQSEDVEKYFSPILSAVGGVSRRLREALDQGLLQVIERQLKSAEAQQRKAAAERERAKQEAQQLLDKALHEADDFAQKAKPLRQLANQILGQ